MTKPATLDGYSDQYTMDCERVLVDTEAYHTLEGNLKKMGFERAENEKQQKLSWRWQTRTGHGALMVLELLADAPDIAGGKVQPLPTEGAISALSKRQKVKPYFLPD